jgi:ankyrin repeat protein
MMVGHRCGLFSRSEILDEFHRMNWLGLTPLFLNELALFFGPILEGSRFPAPLPKAPEYRGVSLYHLDFLTAGYERGTIEHAIVMDDVPAFSRFATSQNWFHPISLSPMDCSGFSRSTTQDVISMIAFHGSIRCFRFLLARDHPPELFLRANFPAITKCALHGGNPEILRYLSEISGVFIFFHVPASCHKLDLLLWISECHGFDIDAPNEKGSTVLGLGASSGSIAIVLFSLQRGADVNLESAGWTPIQLAASGDHYDIFRLLQSHPMCALQKPSSLGDDVLVIAASRSHKTILASILQNSEVDVNVCTKGVWQTPLHIAAKHGDTEVVTILLNDPRVDVNPRDESLRTPLHYAANRGHKEIVTIFCRHPGCYVTAKDNVRFAVRGAFFLRFCNSAHDRKGGKCRE